MGVVKLPWVDEDWFVRVPFNYCDHFGDKKILEKICVVCREEVEREKRYLALGKDPHDLNLVFRDMAKDLAKTHVMITKKALELGIDLDNLPEVEDKCPAVETFPIYNLVFDYGTEMSKFILSLEPRIKNKRALFLRTIIEVLAHSRFYVCAKIGRAVHSRWEEEKDAELPDDSKTSAFLAYLAIKRNSLVLRGLVHYCPRLRIVQKAIALELASRELCQLLRKEFFPKEKMEYKEWGCDYLDEMFSVSEMG